MSKIAVIQINAAQPHEAQSFYEELFGWTFTPLEGTPLHAARVGELVVIIAPTNPNHAPGELSIGVAGVDLDAAERRLAETGGAPYRFSNAKVFGGDLVRGRAADGSTFFVLEDSVREHFARATEVPR